MVWKAVDHYIRHTHQQPSPSDYSNNWPELMPPHPRGATERSQQQNKLQQQQQQQQTQRLTTFSPLPRAAPWGALGVNVTTNQSFDGDDGNSTTTSGSYTVDDMSPRSGYTPDTACA